jgi:hypothetical protein
MGVVVLALVGSVSDLCAAAVFARRDKMTSRRRIVYPKPKRAARHKRRQPSGTSGSNPLCSSSQSISAVNPEAVSEKPRTLAAVCGWLGDVRRDVQAANRASFALFL